MTDPFDRLRDALGGVPVPDQWSQIEARAAAGDLPDAPLARGRHGRTIARWSAAAAALAVLVTGIVVIANRDTSAPASPPGETLPAPSPTTEPPTPAALPCTSAGGLSAVLRALSPNVANLDYGPRADVMHLLSTGDATIVADIASVARSGSYARLEFAGPPTLLSGSDGVDAVSLVVGEWDPANGPDPLAAPIAFEGVRVVTALQSLSVAPVWTPALGNFFIGCAGTDVAAIDIGNRAPLEGNPSIDDLIDAMIAALGAPPDTAPMTPTTVAPCATHADLDALGTLLLPTPLLDYDVAADLDTLLGRVDTVFRATLASANRAVDGDVALHLADVAHLAGEVADVSVIEAESSWASDAGPDPLGEPVGFDGVELVVFASRHPEMPTRWIPDIQGVFAACSNGATYVRPLREPAPFLDHSSLDAMAAELVGHDRGPWGARCDELTGTGSPQPDPADWDELGPIGAAPGLDIALPVIDVPAGYSASTASINRVPGGLLVTMRSGGPGPSKSVLTVVNHDGTIRWRRCLDAGLFVTVPAPGLGVVLVQFWHVDTATTWAALDLATGATGAAAERVVHSATYSIGGRFVLFGSAQDETIDANSRVQILDSATGEWSDAPYPGGAHDHPASEVWLSAYDVDGSLAIGLPGGDGVPVRVYVDDVWGPFDPASANPAMQALGTHVAAQVDVQFFWSEDPSLTARDGWGNELWRRADLGTHAGEGFTVAGPFGDGDDALFLVDACTDLAEWHCTDTRLMAIDAHDGHTVWEYGDRRGYGVADGNVAVVTTDASGQAWEMIDVRSGESVAGTPTWAGAELFRTGCCGEYDYQRAEVTGGVAWTLMYDHLLVWYPQGATSGTVTVDLLGG
ncbi:MAG TPA: hypothetical protein VNQ73_01890 [Ilumatobacter sp.]|nr:hypothetical protein [Ilumatobacter sp.]